MYQNEPDQINMTHMKPCMVIQTSWICAKTLQSAKGETFFWCHEISSILADALSDALVRIGFIIFYLIFDQSIPTSVPIVPAAFITVSVSTISNIAISAGNIFLAWSPLSAQICAIRFLPKSVSANVPIT